MDIINDQNCFVSVLERLRESSKDAVVSAEVSDEFTLYMHVDRPVQEAFVRELEKAAISDHAELILLCGSVGDGKSHMLSYCKEKYPEYMNKFYIHNDSTASLYVDKPASYTLKKILEEFSDERIENSTSKVILAINLGTLSNFFDEDKEHKFERLKNYVETAGILDDSITEMTESPYFHNVNFADYHLYELTEEGPQSEYILKLLQKITNKDSNNPFFKAYTACCQGCDSYDKCPVRVNYELLGDENFRRGIINIIIECIVKNKLIISTRALLNFIYEILNDERHFDRGSLEPKKQPEKMTQLDYCNALLPTTLFNRGDSSELLKAMHNIDPLRIRNEAIDEFIVSYENTDCITEIFHRDLPEYEYLIERLKDDDFSDPANYNLKESLLHLYVRLCHLSGKQKEMIPNDQIYAEFMHALYHWNTGDIKKLKQVYNFVEKGILSWNGATEKSNEMQLFVGNANSSFHLYQEIKMERVTDNLTLKPKEKLTCFGDELKLKFKNSAYQGILDIDFALYSLLKRVGKGYVPNVIDKRVNVKCEEFVKRISSGGSKMKALTIRDLSQKKMREFRLQYDNDFGYSFEES